MLEGKVSDLGGRLNSGFWKPVLLVHMSPTTFYGLNHCWSQQWYSRFLTSRLLARGPPSTDCHLDVLLRILEFADLVNTDILS